jgi:hypothetical protein
MGHLRQKCLVVGRGLLANNAQRVPRPFGQLRVQTIAPNRPDRIGKRGRIRNQMQRARIQIFLDISRVQIGRPLPVNDKIRRHRPQRKRQPRIR